MQTKEFKASKVSATVREETGDDVLLKRRLLTKFYDKNNPDDVDRWYEFFDILVQSENVVTPFPWPLVTADESALRAARDAFLALPGRVYRKWKDTLGEVNADPDDADLLPPDKLDLKEGATPMSPENETNSDNT